MIASSYMSLGETLILKSLAHELINSGIDSSNVSDAVELLLMIESDYEINSIQVEERKLPPMMIRFIVLNIMIIIIGFLRPKNIIGIGKRLIVYKFYKFWIRFIQILLPIFMLSPFFEIIRDWLIGV